MGYGVSKNESVNPLSSTAIVHKQTEHNNLAFNSSDISRISALDSDATDQIEYTRGCFTTHFSNRTPNHGTAHEISLSTIQPIFLFNKTAETVNDCNLQSTKITANLSPIPQSTNNSVKSKTSIFSHTSTYLQDYSVAQLIYNNLLNLVRLHPSIEYVCVSSYVATFVDDLTVNSGDAILVLKDNKDEWLFVQLVENGKQGYIPRDSVTYIQSFLERLNEQINKTKSSAVSLSINV